MLATQARTPLERTARALESLGMVNRASSSTQPAETRPKTVTEGILSLALHLLPLNKSLPEVLASASQTSNRTASLDSSSLKVPKRS